MRKSAYMWLGLGLALVSAGAAAQTGTPVTNSGNGVSGTVPVYSGAATLGAGITLSKVATTGNYNDLADAPLWEDWGGNVYAPGIIFVSGHANLGGTSDIGATLNVAGWSSFSGNVGIGFTNPATPLSVLTSNGSTGLTIGIDGTYSNNRPRATLGVSGWQGVFGLYNSADSQTVSINAGGNSYFTGGNVGIGTTAPAYSLDVAGVARAQQGVIYPDGNKQTTAWTGVLCGGDYAEAVDVKGSTKSYEPGDVLVIGAESGSDVVKSFEPYSTSVTGVYATKPGVVGRRQTIDAKSTTTEVPMAMVGIVPTKVSAENGPIKRGDLLVSSSTPGYAMKGTDHSKMLGAVLGKALGNLDSGTGTIEVVITLQ